MLGDVFNFKTDICMYKNLILEVILITIILIQLFLGHFEDSLIQQILSVEYLFCGKVSPGRCLKPLVSM